MTTEDSNPHVYQEQHVEETISQTESGATLRSRKVTTTTTTTTSTHTSSSSSSSTSDTDRSNHNKQTTGKLAGVGLYKTLGTIQAASGIGLATFVAVHVVSPMLAAVGGTDLANNGMLWGRVFYQNPIVEIGLITGSFALHVLSGTLRATIRTYWKAKKNSRAMAIPGEETSAITTDEKKETQQQQQQAQVKSQSFLGSLFSSKAPGIGLYEWQRWSGWLLIPFLLVHVGMYRLLPIVIYGDSSLIDYSLVTWMFREGGQALHYFGFIPLVFLGLYHGTGGLFVSIDRSLPRGSRFSLKRLKELNWYQSALAWVVMPLALVGLWRIVEAPGPIPMAKYYQKMWELPQ